MFSLVNCVYESYWASPHLNVLIVGAQGAGKTTLLERVKVTQVRKRPPPLHLTHQAVVPSDLRALLQGASSSANSSASTPQNSNHTRSSVVVETTTTTTTATGELGTPKSTRKRLAWVCPAPKRYAAAAADEEEVEEEFASLMDLKLPDLSSSPSATMPAVPPPSPPGRLPQTSAGSLDSVEINTSVRHGSLPTPPSTSAATTANTTTAVATPPRIDYNLKPKAKMISLIKIRPTIGMNLGKVDLAGAKCQVWDLGGRLVDLWERYYADCDAVIFVWKCGRDDDALLRDPEEADAAARPPITYQLQESLLNQVRSAIGDEIPLLVLAHVHGEDQVVEAPMADTVYQTDALLPHYHNPLQALRVANAATGQGVAAALEWIVPLAKRQKAVREKSMEKLP
jgi:GTPase SAR1 family protein